MAYSKLKTLLNISPDDYAFVYSNNSDWKNYIFKHRMTIWILRVQITCIATIFITVFTSSNHSDCKIIFTFIIWWSNLCPFNWFEIKYTISGKIMSTQYTIYYHNWKYQWGLSLEIYFGSSLHDRTLNLLEERWALKQSKCSMF